MANIYQFSTFYLDGLLFGVEVNQVQEVLRYQEMTPLAPRGVKGLINLRGQIVMALDLRQRLALSPRAPEDIPMNVIMRTDDGMVSFLVDAIGDSLEVGVETFEPPPEMLRGIPRELIRGTYKLQNCQLHALDTDRALAVGASA
ncbi:chemotaxis protein CheW [Candidatus Entotheonella serta]|nr:chemotaxis protein CheW [Candidatus Entotheonella serta]